MSAIFLFTFNYLGVAVDFIIYLSSNFGERNVHKRFFLSFIIVIIRFSSVYFAILQCDRHSTLYHWSQHIDTNYSRKWLPFVLPNLLQQILKRKNCHTLSMRLENSIATWNELKVLLHGNSIFWLKYQMNFDQISNQWMDLPTDSFDFIVLPCDSSTESDVNSHFNICWQQFHRQRKVKVKNRLQICPAFRTSFHL